VTLKLKFTDFQIMTRAKSLAQPVSGKAEFATVSRAILDEALPLPMPVRLMGLTLSNLEGEDTDERPPDTAQLSLL
jgi:DNA polymerase-4